MLFVWVARFAALLAVAFHAYLRAGELVSLRCRNIRCGAAVGVVTLVGTKTSRRAGGVETIKLDCPITLRLLRGAMRNMCPEDLFWDHTPQRFRRVFAGLLTLLGVGPLGFTLYSFRRVRATHDFLRYQARWIAVYCVADGAI